MQWHSGSIAEAVSEAKRNQKLFLVYIEGSDEMSKSMTCTYDDPSISEKLSTENVIALKLIANSVPFTQFCQIYPVLVIPSSYFIAGNGAPIEIISGSLEPEEFASKLDKVFEIYEKSHPVKPSNINAASTSSQNNAGPSTAGPSSSISSDISQPSTSQATSASDPTPSLDDKLERAKTLIEAQRQSKALEEQEKEKNEEIARRNMGKAMQQAQLTKKESEMKEWAINRAKEKEEERLAREKVKAMIAQDRAEQAARYQRVKEAEDAERQRLQQIRENEERAAREATMHSNDARLQFRLPDGSYSTHCFPADASLEEARRYVREEVRPPFSNFSLCTTFPRRHFTETDYPETFRALHLAPSAVLLILPEQAVARSNINTNFFSNMFWFFLSPVTTIWNYLRSFFTNSTASQSSPPRPTTTATSAQPVGDKESQSDSDNRQSAVRRRESPFAKREGNIFRINNQSDDDENNTWNGNSTQQM